MKLGFVGCGNLAQALIEGIISHKICKPNHIFAYDLNIKNISKFSNKTKIIKCQSNQQVIKSADIIFIATKPQDINLPLNEIKNHITKNKIIVSLAAGINTASLLKYVPHNTTVRVMASLSSKIQKGVYGIYFKNAAPAEKLKIKKIFSKIGFAIEVSRENQIDAITAGSASGVGFVFELMRIFENWFMRHGFTKNISKQIAIETFLGAALLANLSQTDLSELRNAVTSKKGTTLAGLKSMKNSQISKKMHKALSQAHKRAKELSKN